MAKIAVDCGHGLYTSGKRCLKSLDVNETREWTLNSRVGVELIRLLQSAGHTILRVDDPTGKTDVSLANRVAKANNWKADYYISVHHNAGLGGRAGGGTVMYKYNGTSGVTKQLQEAIYNHAIIRGNLKGNRYDGTLDNNFYVIRETSMPAGLIECGFMDSPTDIKLILDPAWSKKMALGIAEGICEVLGGKINASASTESKPTETTTSTTLYRIRKTWANSKSQIGAFAKLDNAKKNCPTGYSVFDENGKAVYVNAESTSSSANSQLFRVRLTWADSKSQIGAYANLDGAKEKCDANPGYTVFDSNGTAIYTSKVAEQPKEEPKEETPVVPEQPKEEEVKPVEPEVTTPEEPKEETPVVPEAPEAVDISPVKGMDNDVFINYIGELAKADMEKTGVLASVTMAQAILESGWGQSELSLKANNLFGMKATLSGNTWESDWDGKIYAKRSNEEINGEVVSVLSDFRAYDSIEASIKDHSDYLCGAMKGSELRYKGLKGELDYRKAIQIIKDGGYATDSGYVDKICKLIETYDLDEWDGVKNLIEEDQVFEELEIKIDNLDAKFDKTNGLLATLIEILNKFIESLIGSFK